MIGAAAGVGVVLGDTQAGTVMEKPVKDERRLVLGGRDHGRVEGIVLVGGVGVEGKARIDAVTGVDLPAASPRLPDRKNWPSDAEVVPSPHTEAIGNALCASTMHASAARYVSSRI